MQIPTVKVKAWDEDQGEFVIINADDFDPKMHEMFGEDAPAKPAPKAEPQPAPKAKAKSARKAKAKG